MRKAVLLLTVLFVATVALAQPMTLAVDATDAARGILHSRMTIPVTAGPATLLYPKWIPGEHGPTGPLTNLVNVQITAGGQRIAWQRDPLEMYALHIDVPAGTTSLDVTADFLLPSSGGFTAGRTATPALGVISWNTALLFPKGRPADEIIVQPSLRVPSGWKFASSLGVERTSGDVIEFKPVSLTLLVDSPVQIGAYQKVVSLREADGRAHQVVLVGESMEALETPKDFATVADSLVKQGGIIFGGRHYNSYRWLLTLSDGVAHFGLEHHESSDNRLSADSLATPKGHRDIYSLLSHEYGHSWNGKYRRPAGLLSPDFSTPMQTELLWVYEGLTEYLGYVLTVRAGGWKPEEFREALAHAAANLESQVGRTWRPLIDTAVQAQVLFGAPSAWWSLRRGVDFYGESIFIWLEADAIIRDESGGKRSLDDFLAKFYGGMSGPAVKPYTFDELVTAINSVHPHDWRTFFNTRLQSVKPGAPLGGVIRAGWRFELNETPNAYRSEVEQAGTLNLRNNLGMSLGREGVISDLAPSTPAAKAGLAPGFTIIAVNGVKYSPDVMRRAIKSKQPIEVIAQNGDYFAVHRIEYSGGLLHPHLVRDTSKPDLLSAILKAR